MVRRQVRITDELGLHARPAAKIADIAQRYKARLFLRKGKRIAEAQSILDVLTLACSKNSIIEIIGEGEEAEKAVAALAEFLEGRPDESS